MPGCDVQPVAWVALGVIALVKVSLGAQLTLTFMLLTSHQINDVSVPVIGKQFIIYAISFET